MAMPGMMDEATASAGAGPDMAPEAAPAPAGGYLIELYADADGTYRVEGPNPIEATVDADESAGSVESFPSVGAALKEVLRIVKENPAGGGEQEQFDAGYTQR